MVVAASWRCEACPPRTRPICNLTAGEFGVAIDSSTRHLSGVAMDFLCPRNIKVLTLATIASIGLLATPLPADAQWAIRNGGKLVNYEQLERFGIDYSKYERMQSRLAELSRMPHADREKLERMQLSLDFLGATTKQGRASLLRKMGVTMTVTPSIDGQGGKMLNFIVRGKVRRQMYLPPPSGAAGRARFPVGSVR